MGQLVTQYQRQILRAAANNRVCGQRNFFPINALGMGRFKLFDLVGYS